MVADCTQVYAYNPRFRLGAGALAVTKLCIVGSPLISYLFFNIVSVANEENHAMASVCIILLLVYINYPVFSPAFLERIVAPIAEYGIASSRLAMTK